MLTSGVILFNVLIDVPVTSPVHSLNLCSCLFTQTVKWGLILQQIHVFCHSCFKCIYLLWFSGS